MESLFFRFSGSQIEWLVFDGRGQLQHQQTAAPEEFRSANKDFSGLTVFVVPGEDVLLTAANVPSRQQRQIIQAVPYVVEDHLAQDVEDCFFALGERDGDGNVRVAVVDRARMESWVDRLSGLELNVTIFVSENDLVASRDRLYAIQDGPRMHLGWGQGRGLTGLAEDLPMLISLLDSKDRLELEGDAEALERQLSELEASGTSVQVQPLDSSAFLALALGYTGQQINLRQGRYRVEKETAPSYRIWRSVAGLAAVGLLLHLLLQFGQGMYLSLKSEELRDQSLALYSEIFPEDRNVRDIRRRWKAHLGPTGVPDSNFISLFAQAARGLPGAGLTLENVNFNESRGDLILQVTGDRSELLVQYAQQLSREGLNAEIGTISQEEGSIRGSIKVKFSGGAS